MAPRVERRLAAILAADVVGYSRLVGADDAGTIARLRALRRDFIEPLITEYRGRVVKLVGDGALVEFASAVGAEVALMNAGGIRGDRTYQPGTVLTRNDVLTELPFGNVVVLIGLSGADLLAALENGVSQIEDDAGRFAQVSGMSYAYDPKRPPGSRIVEVEVGGDPLDVGGPIGWRPTITCSAAATATRPSPAARS
jgi:hypothetical protein